MILPFFDDFLLSLKTNNYSLETVYNYERDLKVFEAYLTASPTPSFEKVTKRTIDEYKAYLVSQDRQTPIKEEKKETQLSPQSINRMLSALRSYLKFLVDRDVSVPVVPKSSCIRATCSGARMLNS